MSNEGKYGEPWRKTRDYVEGDVNGCHLASYIETADRKLVAQITDMDRSLRAIASVNACDGADDPQPGELARLRRERDEAFALLDEVLSFSKEAHEKCWEGEIFTAPDGWAKQVVALLRRE